MKANLTRRRMTTASAGRTSLAHRVTLTAIAIVCTLVAAITAAGTTPAHASAGYPVPPGTGGESSGATLPNAYDADGAANWAKANAYGGNPYGYGDDCTDFVSRAMHFGGGMPFIGDATAPVNHTDDGSWYIRQFGSRWVGTYSWGAAAHLYDFLVQKRFGNGVGSGREVGLDQAKPGDVIFVNWGPGGRDTPAGNPAGTAGIDHAGMIVGNPGRAGNDDVQIAQHTSDKIENLSDWRKTNPNMQIWVFSIYVPI